MNLFLRIDDRFIHGQVGVTWISYVGANEIILINDDLANDSLASMMQKMTVPTMKVVIKTLKGGEEYLRTHKNTKPIFIIVASPQDALYLVKENRNINYINIGHSARKDESVEIYPYLFVGQEELDAFRELQNLGIELDYRLVPDHKKPDIDFNKVELKL